LDGRQPEINIGDLGVGYDAINDSFVGSSIGAEEGRVWNGNEDRHNQLGPASVCWLGQGAE